MKKFVYVQVYYHNISDKLEGALSFRHAIIKVKKGDVPYDVGFKALQNSYTAGQEPLNDYVVEI